MRDWTESVIHAARAWLEIDGVEGIAEGREAGEPCLVVLVSLAPEPFRRRLPTRVFGLQVVVRRSRCSKRASLSTSISQKAGSTGRVSPRS